MGHHITSLPERPHVSDPTRTKLSVKLKINLELYNGDRMKRLKNKWENSMKKNYWVLNLIVVCKLATYSVLHKTLYSQDLSECCMQNISRMVYSERNHSLCLFISLLSSSSLF
jgi:hypothetical protein